MEGLLAMDSVAAAAVTTMAAAAAKMPKVVTAQVEVAAMATAEVAVATAKVAVVTKQKRVEKGDASAPRARDRRRQGGQRATPRGAQRTWKA